MSTSRRYCFTLNNPTDDELRVLGGLVSGELLRYCIWGREVGASGTPHLQGYVEYTRPIRPRQCKTVLGSDRVHVEAARGSAEQNIAYCSKEDHSPFICGEPSRGQGSRNDLEEVAVAIANGASAGDLAREYFGSFVKYHRGFQMAIDLRVVDRTWRTQVVYRYGPTGSGKSRSVGEEGVRLSGGKVAWISDPSLKWFDGWDPACKVAIIDDFRGQVDIGVLLRLFDRYPYQVQIKGGWLKWTPRIVYITSNFPLTHFYGNEAQWDALKRRIDSHEKLDYNGLTIEWSGVEQHRQFMNN